MSGPPRKNGSPKTGAPREVHAWIVGTIAEVELLRPQRIS
jgi:hypothetical protein